MGAPLSRGQARTIAQDLVLRTQHSNTRMVNFSTDCGGQVVQWRIEDSEDLETFELVTTLARLIASRSEPVGVPEGVAMSLDEVLTIVGISRDDLVTVLHENEGRRVKKKAAPSKAQDCSSAAAPAPDNALHSIQIG